MSRIRALTATLAVAVVGVIAFLLPGSTAQAAQSCDTPWNSATVYWGGDTASHNGRNYTAQWWTQNEAPGTASVWTDNGPCDGGGNPPSDDCDHPSWVAGTWYPAGSIVRYSDGNLYIAEHDNPGYDPVISTWYWNPYQCDGGGDPDPSGFVVTESQFQQMFPNRNPFYTYSGLVTAAQSFPAFAAGGTTVAKQEAAAFLANVSHETGGLVHIVEQNQANYPHYCDTTQPYGCPAGNDAYYGRGPIQLSWNFNYNAAGNALGLPLLTNPWLVEQDSAVAWKTAIWYWMTQSGPGSMTAHNAMVGGHGFGETIRAINGALECDGGNPGQVQSRVTKYQSFTSLLGVAPGGNLYC
ncbi:chitinase [Stackebrandtia albiflava]|uniref:Chitinase n=1 Tax=Stackebrandtia albiflava TaxID=406432 RepID=A0A562V1T5_9ACTN|nr:glycoside hydrolase family 19 protein [Stackebrandtia albiflava]TWJ11783.1 chitinase [Stackebrandtia albiflava]